MIPPFFLKKKIVSAANDILSTYKTTLEHLSDRIDKYVWKSKLEVIHCTILALILYL